MTRAAIVDVMIEPAATVDGTVDRDNSPAEMVTVTDLDMPSHVAVITAVPVVNELSVTVAIPFELVYSDKELNTPWVVENATGTFGAGIPITSRTVTVIVDVICEFAAITDGAADITICGSLTRTASKGIV